jgi:hypothetical protein
MNYFKLLLLAIMLIADYLFTFIGIKINFITEANPLMKWAFKLPLTQGLLYRIAIALCLTSMLWFARKKKYFKKLMIGITGAYSIVFVLHLFWIAQL